MSTERSHIADTVAAGASSAPSMPARMAPASGAEQRSGTPAGVHASIERGAVVVVPVPGHTATPHAPNLPGSPAQAPSDIHVASNLRDLLIAAPQESRIAKERRDLNAVVHRVLIIGLLISTALMLAGVGLDLFYQRDLPTAVPDIGEVINRVIALRPSGFLALGLLVLIATPILRVIGSIGAFVYERDWRFAGIAALVLGVLLISLVLGRG